MSLSLQIPGSFAEMAEQGPLGVFVHDAGSANHILSWLISTQNDDARVTRVFAAGPAKALFTAAGVDLVGDVHGAAQDVYWVVVGTGWPNNFQQLLMKSCAYSGIPVIAVVDHWINYDLRFSGLSSSERPYGVVVTDSEALAIARRDLPWARTVEWENAQLAQFGTTLSCSQGERNSVVWLNEPVWERGRLVDPLGLDVVGGKIRETLAQAVRRFGLSRVTLRQHPSLSTLGSSPEDPRVGPPVLPVQYEISPSDRRLAEDVAHASLVLGINSYGLFLSSHYQPDTYSLATTLGYRNHIPKVYVKDWPYD